MNTVVFSLFSDIHHYPGVFKSQTPEHLFQIQERAVANNVDFIIHCGDLTHGPSECLDFIDLYNNFQIPSYHCLGNHDADHTPLETVLKLYKMPAPYYYFDVRGFRMIVTCADYMLLNGEYIPYSLGNYYKHPECRDYVPPEEIEWLKEVIARAPGHCLIFSHESYEREVAGVKNRHAVRAIIDSANREQPGKVLMCMNGHHHRNHLSIINQVAYFDVNSASYDWLENEHSCYPAEECERIRLLNHTVCWNDPVHAIVRVAEDGTIDIDGMESSMYLGVQRTDTGNRYADLDGRPVEPAVLSAHMRLLSP